MAQTGRDFFQHRKVEVDDIPTRQHVGIDLRDASAECVQRGGLVLTARRVLRHDAIAAIDDENLIDAGGVQ